MKHRIQKLLANAGVASRRHIEEMVQQGRVTTNRLTHPRYGVAKTYRAAVDGFIKGDTLEQLKHGMWLADPKKGGFKTGRSHISIITRTRNKTIIEITIREGRNPQVRRMLAKV